MATTTKTQRNVDGSAAREANGALEGDQPPANAAATPRLRAYSASSSFSDLEFLDCDPVPVNYEQYILLRDAKRRIELWDRGAGTAWELRDGPTGQHEWPICQLKEMMVLMAAVRGIPVPCFGDRGLAVLDEDDLRLRVLHPDQSVYINRPVNYDHHRDIPVQRVGWPDIVMEVDYSTNTRGGKIDLYEDMGVPELWIEVPELWVADYIDAKLRPDGRPPRHAHGHPPGLSIFLLEGGRYREYSASRALLGWKAEEIHDGLNDLDGLSPRHCEVLADLGRRFGERTGTGPDDHPLMRMMRQQSRDEGRAAGRAEGHAAGRAEGQAEMVRQVLQRRGIVPSSTFAADIANFANLPADALLDAAMACDSERDFHARLQRR